MARPYLKSFCAIAAIAFLGISWVGYRAFSMPAVEPHSGDGRFENHSWRFPYGNFGLPIPGYEIDFERFDLGQPFEASYRIERLPAIPNYLGVYLSLSDPAEKFWRDEARQPLTATVEITVFDQDGAVVCDVKRPIKEMVWAHPEGGPDTFGVYDLDESFFEPQPGERYEIRLKYLPDAALTGMEGFVHIRCGGSI